MAIRVKEFTKPLGIKNEDRMRYRFRLESGTVTDLMIQYEAKIEEEWYDIVRYDFAHRFFHRDLISPKGEKVKKKIEIDDMKLAALYAEEDLKDRWEWYRENYVKQCKKK
jgi:hypothetical protein